MSETYRHVIIGTSGHIDHGKSAIVRALTGSDPDRFKEEKQRGMTIDLGYAFLSDSIAFIDVPGHERFIKNMVAGVTTIDMVMLVIAADDGVMPQTREHLDILHVLGVQSGLIVLNKIDLVEDEWIDLVEEDVRELVRGTFLEGAPILRVSATTGTGLEDLRMQLERMAAEVPPRRNPGYFWMPIDRSFSVQGFGTVVTGSVISGDLSVGQEVLLLPQEIRIKVRGLQRHGKPSQRVQLGDRAAVNLHNIHWQKVKRGNILASPEYGIVTQRLDAKIILLPSSPWPLKDQERLRFHIGTSEIFVRTRLLDKHRLEPGEQGYVQFILEQPIAANRQDRFVVRKYSPPLTIGGGVILDNAPLKRHKRFNRETMEHFRKLEANEPSVLVLDFLEQSRHFETIPDISRATCLLQNTVTRILAERETSGEVIRVRAGSGDRFMAKGIWLKIEKTILNELSEFHKNFPHLPGISSSELASRIGWHEDVSVLEHVLTLFAESGEVVFEEGMARRKDFSPRLSDVQERCLTELRKRLNDAKFSPPSVKEIYAQSSYDKRTLDAVFAFGKKTGEFVVLGNGLIYTRSTIETMQELIRQYVKQHQTITVSVFRDLMGASRKFAVAVLEYFDEIGYTIRDGDERRLKQPFESN